jgi:hypothetical protein
MCVVRHGDGAVGVKDHDRRVGDLVVDRVTFQRDALSAPLLKDVVRAFLVVRFRHSMILSVLLPFLRFL